jgi:hypothetical protein
MKRKKKGPGSAKQRGLSKLTVKNYHQTLRCVDTDADECKTIACQGFRDLDPLRVKVHRAPKKRSRRRQKQPDPEQLVWAEAEQWLMKLNDEGAA